MDNSATNKSLQHEPVSISGSQHPRPNSGLGASRTPPLSFTPSLSATALHTPVSPSTLSQSPRTKMSFTPQLSSSSSSPNPFSPRESSLSQSLLSRVQNQLSFADSSSLSSPLMHDAASPLSPSSSFPSLDSSSSLSASSPALSTPSTLSPAAPQFQMKPRLLDAPINIHELRLSSAQDGMHGRTRTTSGGISGSDVLSLTTALLNEGPTPTQESFKSLQLPSRPADSVQTKASSAPFGPPNPTTHIIEIDDSPIPPSEASPSTGSSGASPSLVAGFSHPALVQYQTHGNPGPRMMSPASTMSDSQSADADDFKTPNVYINGLPPNFPEDQLLAMTREFGEVVSVRTFTRHVSDRPSGYGFVLFGSVQAAEKCIEALRKYRNLHPSYSKRIHKIPGTTYATAHAEQSVGSSVSNSPSESSSESDSFKARMEKLHDTSSTNLYVEGLPMDINEPTLQALVSPHKIMSSRFFQTRLSVPARVIAFVRLETRKAAEEIIERLHGRMVRGWADAGCRISVRFADTSEQRELRRMERMNRDGDQSPARLTVAQAALLNLKGGQLQTSPSPTLMTAPSLVGFSPPFGVASLPSLSGQSPHFPAIGLRDDGLVSSTGSLPSSVGYEAVLHSNTFNHNDSFLTQQLANRSMAPSPLPLSHHSDQHHRIHQFTQSSHLPLHGQANSNSAYDLLLNSRAGEMGGVPLRMPLHHDGFGSHMSLADVGNDVIDAAGLASRPHDGYTALEREILQKYLQHQQLQQQILRQNQSIGPARGSGGTTSASVGRRLMDPLPPLSEEDFHARGGTRRAVASNRTSAPGVSVHLSHAIHGHTPAVPPSRLAMDDVDAKLKFTRQRNQTHSSGFKLPRSGSGVDGDGHSGHELEERARSTTVPEGYLGRMGQSDEHTLSGVSSADYGLANTNTKYDSQASDISIDSSIDTNSLICSGPPYNGIPSTSGKNDHKSSIRNKSSNSPSDTSPSSTSSSDGNVCTSNTNNNTHKHANTRIDTSLGGIHHNRDNSNIPDPMAHSNTISYHNRGASGSDGNVSPLDSPALTYSNSTRTPATLSPATPFSAFAEGPPFDGGVVVAGANSKGEVGLGVNLNAAREIVVKDASVQPPSEKAVAPAGRQALAS
ncbi:hypothetical protein BXZ70DRAFT_1009343 [Cristinia sonorae]|uniref:RRM domain-containing protein n=1 Tax=Cristinia sonorae TaxID=1940300 RepID=A0A8K0UM28_9AGAR|nr:hypothetical protein BXZ70DRAFT_1009343 [Cristinia sonorae]